MKKLLVGMFAFVTISGCYGAMVTTVYASHDGMIKYEKAYNNTANQQYNYNTANRYNLNGHNSDAQLRQQITYLQSLLAELQHSRGGNYSYANYSYSNNNGDVTAMTRSAEMIEDDRATIVGEVDFNNSDEATVYFDWGTSINNLRYATTHIVIDDMENEEEFTARLTDLDEGTTYYFQAVAEDDNREMDKGSVLSFQTDKNNARDDHNNNNHRYNDDYPDIDTDQAQSITDTSARLTGMVDMNEYGDGQVFFVYGDDEDMIDEVADDYSSYLDVDEDGDQLMKLSVDSSLDGQDDYRVTVSGLEEDTEIFYSLCVAFEDEDNDDVIVCGNTDSFVTDNN